MHIIWGGHIRWYAHVIKMKKNQFQQGFYDAKICKRKKGNARKMGKAKQKTHE